MSLIRARTVARCMYSTRILDGWRINDKQIEKTALRLSHIRSETGKVPGLAVLRFGYNAEAERFIERKKDIALTCGINLQDIVFDASCKTEEVQEKIRLLNQDRSIHGIVVKCPLPSTINQEAVLSTISPLKDVDGCSNTNEGRLLKLGENKRRASDLGKADDIHYFNMVNFPTSALATLCLIESYKLPLEKKKATVIGRSNSVGLPIALLLTHKDVTCQLSHGHNDITGEFLKESDYVISAQGTPIKLKGDMLKSDCTVIDIGPTYANTATSDEIFGSVDVDTCCNVAGNITPVPGGTGMLSTIMLMENTMKTMVLQENILPLYEKMGGKLSYYQSLLNHC